MRVYLLGSAARDHGQIIKIDRVFFVKIAPNIALIGIIVAFLLPAEFVPIRDFTRSEVRCYVRIAALEVGHIRARIFRKQFRLA